MIVLELSIVVPTYNEAINVEPLYDGIREVMEGVRFELIFVDDHSPDGTADQVRALARRVDNVRCIERIGRRGLASACVEGALSSSADFVAVMDGDMQHDERILPEMLARLRRGDADVAVGSRYVDGGSAGEWTKERAAGSLWANRLATLAIGSEVRDLMSGYFMTRASLWRETAERLSAVGFKILIDLLASSPRPLRVSEVPYTFRMRRFGESKLDATVVWDFLMLLWEKRFGRFMPARFMSFGLVGCSGVAVHLAALGLARAAGMEFLIGQAVATATAMTSNFLLNNLLTYRDRRLRGTRDMLRGWLSFAFASSLSAAANVGVAGYIHDHGSGWIVSAAAGIAVGTIWNFLVTRRITWRA
jgi:dolichol-phosphate mannosyltransferase